MSTETTAPEGQVAPGVVAPAAPATPAPAAPAPVAPVAPTEGKEPPAPVAESQYEPTGDPGLDYALSFLSRAGIADDDPALVAASEGNFALLKAKLAEKGVAGWEQAVALGEQAHQRLVEAEKAKASEVEEAVLAVAANSGANWEQVVEWARGAATPEEVEAVNGFFAQGKLGAKIAASYLIQQYQAASGSVAQPPARQAVSPTAVPAPAAAAAQGPLNRVQFAEQAQALYKTFGDSYTQRPEYAALARRLAR